MKYTEYYKKETCNLFIITDANKKPMSWSKKSKQLCFADGFDEYVLYDKFSFSNHPLFVLQIYTHKQAILYMKKSKAMRKKNNIALMKYRLMPIFNNTNTISVTFK